MIVFVLRVPQLTECLEEALSPPILTIDSVSFKDYLSFGQCCNGFGRFCVFVSGFLW